MTTTRSRGLGHHAEIVGDQHDGGAGLLLQLQHQVEDLRLDGDVERRGRLVGDQHLRIAGRAPWRSSRAGACRRRAGADIRRAGAWHRRCAPGRASRAARSRAARHDTPEMAHDVLGDLRADGQHRVEAGHRLLEDHRDAMAAQALHRLFAERRQLLALEADRARGDAAGLAAGSGAGWTAPSPTCRSPIRRRCRASRRAPGRTTRRRPRARRRPACRTGCAGRGPRGSAFTAVSPAADRAGRAARRPAGSPPAR